MQRVEVSRKGKGQLDDGGRCVRRDQEVLAVEVQVVQGDADAALLLVAGSEGGAVFTVRVPVSSFKPVSRLTGVAGDSLS